MLPLRRWVIRFTDTFPPVDTSPLPPIPSSTPTGGTGNGSAHKPFLGLSGVPLQPFQHSISRSLLPMPPAPAVLHQCVIDVGAIGENYISNGALALVEALSLKGNFVSKDQL